MPPKATQSSLMGPAALLAICAGLLPSNPALAYVRSTTTSSQTPLRWMFTDCVIVRPNAAGTADVPNDGEFKAIERAVENWRKVTASCSYLTLNLKPRSGDATVAFDQKGYNENVIFWVEKGWKTERGHDPQAAGITTVFFVDKAGSSQDGRILDADIELNGEFFAFSTNGDAKRTDVENTVTHELGHLMGLDHPCDDGSRQPVPKDHLGKPLPSCFPAARLARSMRATTMYNFAVPGETSKRSPEADDVKGICDTYPRDRSPGTCVAADFSPKTGCRIGDPRNNQAAPILLLLSVILLTLAMHRRRPASRPQQLDASDEDQRAGC